MRGRGEREWVMGILGRLLEKIKILGSDFFPVDDPNCRMGIRFESPLLEIALVLTALL